MAKRVMILAGGTGGHVYPALAVAESLRAQGHEITWMGTRKGLEARVVPEAGIRMEWLSVEGLRGRSWRDTLKAPFMLIKALRQSAAILRRVRPDVVLGMGGFASGPGGLMATFFRIPLVLHEQNRVPGTTNRILAKRASQVLEAFPGSFPEKAHAITTGNPLRRGIEVMQGKTRSTEEAGPLRILIVGGSLGAKALNETVPEAMNGLGCSIEILHQTGQAMHAATKAHYEALGIEADVRPFLEKMDEAYTWADVAICRAGAMTVSELAAAGLPAILIPFPYAIDDHQTANARYLSDEGAAILMPQTELTSDGLKAALRKLLETPEALARMADALRTLARPDATSVVANVCLKMANAKPKRPEALE